MIHGAHIISLNGEPLLSRSYDTEGTASRGDPIPPHVRSCVTLFQSRSSTSLENAYSLEQGDNIWTYVFFEGFSIIFLSSKDEPTSELEKRMNTIGKTIARSFGHIIGMWNGDMGDIEGLSELVDGYVSMDVDSPGAALVEDIERIITQSLEDHELAYIGVFDVQGEMLSGNIPASHSVIIRDEISRGAVSDSVDLIPLEMKIRQTRVHMVGVQSLTLAIGTYRSDSRVRAIGVTSEIAELIQNLMVNSNTSSK